MAPLRRLIDDFFAPEQALHTPDLFHDRMLGVSRLLDVTSVLAAEIDPAKILAAIIHGACKALHCERAALYLYDPRRGELLAADAGGVEIRRKLGEDICGCAARHRQTVNVADPAGDPRWNAEYDQRTGFATRNLLAVPLVAPNDGALLGVLQLLNREGGTFNEVDEELLKAFSLHAAVALDRARLIEAWHRQQALRASLDVAREIQRGFMPSKLPNVERYEIATWWFPNEAVGGDYCDVIPFKDGRLGLVVADVSGHGLGPSLLMASVRAALRALVLEHSAAEVLLTMLARSLHGSLQNGRFITMVLAVLNPKDNSLEFANAGHAPALHYEAAAGDFTALESTGMPLGVLDRPEYPQGWPVEMEIGDLIVLGTDGIVEAMDAQDRQFGLGRLKQLLHKAARRPVEEIVRLVGSEVESHFVGDHPPDDLTLLVVRRNR